MGKQVKTQLAQAKRAFEGRDVEMARDLVRQDDVVDNLNKEIFRIALEIGDDHDRREWAMTMILVARAIERIGDNTVDIGEQVAFIVTGLFREFQDASHPGEPDPAVGRLAPRTDVKVAASCSARGRNGGWTSSSSGAAWTLSSGAIRSQGSVPRPGGRWRSSRNGSTPSSVADGPRRAPRLSWT